MNQSVVAVFEDRAQAERARQQLIATGFPSERVSFQLGAGADSAAEAGGSSARADDGERGIGDFFRSLFGMDDDRPEHYEEASRRGHTTLVVHAEGENEVDQLRALLERFDVIDIEERAMQWQSEAPGLLRGQTAGRGMASGRGDAVTDTSVANSVIEEDIRIGNREEDRGRVRVYSRVTERPVEQRAAPVRDNVRRTDVRVDEEAQAASGNESLRGREQDNPG